MGSFELVEATFNVPGRSCSRIIEEAKENDVVLPEMPQRRELRREVTSEQARMLRAKPDMINALRPWLVAADADETELTNATLTSWLKQEFGFAPHVGTVGKWFDTSVNAVKWVGT